MQKCHECKKEIVENLSLYKNKIYSLDGKGLYTGLTLPFHKECQKVFEKARAKWFDELDEVMNSNAYFHRTKGMEGVYKDGELECEVSAYWTRQEIETTQGNEKIDNFRKFLKDNQLKYKYVHRDEEMATKQTAQASL